MSLPTRSEAIKDNLPRYAGKICPRHPELAGERKRNNGKCPACWREQVSVKRKIKRSAARTAERPDFILREAERIAAIEGPGSFAYEIVEQFKARQAAKISYAEILDPLQKHK